MTPLDSLLPELKKTASILALRSYDIEAEDLFQEMCLVILEKAQSDPEFMEQKPNYIKGQAWFVGLRRLEKTYTYRRHIVRNSAAMRAIDSQALDLFESLSEVIEETDLSGQEPRQVETSLVRSWEMAEVFATLDAKNQTIVQGLFIGLEGREIAEEIGISPAAVSQRKKIIARLFEEAEVR